MFKDFLKLFGNVLIMLGITMASFLLLINLYHYRYVSNTYNVDLDNDTYYKNIKSNIGKAEKLMSLDVNKLSGSNYSSAKVVSDSVNKCITVYKDSPLYKSSGVYAFKYYDNYTNMNYLYDDINASCNTLLQYNIKNLTPSSFGSRNGYNDMIYNYDKMFNIVLGNASYVSKKSLNTNSYSYTSDMNKFTIFDELRNDTDFTLKNYEVVSSLILDISTWFDDTYGGDINE